MAEKVPFEDRLHTWSLAELKVEQTRNIYGTKKKERIATRIAEIENGLVEDPGKCAVGNDPDAGLEITSQTSDINWAMWGTIIGLLSVVVVVVIGIYYAE